jgi:hypothetical protein
MKVNNFAKAFKKCMFKAGDSIELFSNSYTVTSCNDKMTLLKDCKNNPVAYPTDKLKSMILKKAQELHKAEGAAQASAPVSVAPKAASPAPKAAKAPTSTGAPKAATGTHAMPTGSMHSGMIRVDKVDSHGKRYHYWVHGTKGSTHVDASENAASHPKQFSEKEMHYYTKIKSIINEHAHGEDKAKLEDKFMKFMVAKSSHDNLKEAYNHMQNSGQGNITTNTIRHIGAMQDIYQGRFKEFSKALTASKQKKIGASNG